MPSDVFRPRLPLDPFARIEHAVPWRIPAELQHSPPQVILVLGEPVAADLHPLLESPYLSQSLLLIATHAPLAVPIPTCPQGPAVRVLRLSAPLHVHDSGALRLVSLLERAQRVAALWRAHPQNTAHILHLAEETPNGEFTLVDKPTENYPSPAPSFTSIKRNRSIRARFSTLSPSLQSPSASSLTSSNSPAKKSRRLSQITLSQLIKDNQKETAPHSHARGFDAIVNFLPTGLLEKALLKHAILVTTLSTQYLALPPGSSGSGSDQHAYPYHYQRRSSLSSPPLPTPLSLPHLPSSSSSASAFSSLSTPPIAKIPAKTHRRFSSFALTSSASTSSSSIPNVSARNVTTPLATPSESGESPAVRSGSFSFSSYGLSSASASGASTAVTTPATSPGCEMSLDEGSSPFYEEDAKTTSRRKSVKKRFSSLFASASSRPASSYGMDMEMGALGSSAKAGRTRPRNAHLVHVLPGDWNPHSHPHPHASTSASASTSTSARTRPRTQHEKPKLVQGIEQFLLSFAYPLSGLGDSSSSSSSSRGHGHASRPAAPPSAYHHSSQSRSQRPTSSGSTLASLLAAEGEGESEKTRAVPYLVAPGLFGRVVGGGGGAGCEREEGEDDESEEDEVVEEEEEEARSHAHAELRQARSRVTLGEAVLLGALDFDFEAAVVLNRAAVGGGRAWIGEGDVELVGGGGDVVQRRTRRVKAGKGKGKELSAVVLAKELELELDGAKAMEKEKEDPTSLNLGLGLPTPPRSQRSSVTSSGANSTEGSAEADVEAGAEGGGLTRSNSAGSSDIQAPVQAKAKAIAITIPPRSVPSRANSNSSDSGSGSGSGVGVGVGGASMAMVMGGVPMSRSPSTGSPSKKPHYVPARLVAQQQQQQQQGEALKVPRAVHLPGAALAPTQTTSTSTSKRAQTHLLNGVEIDSDRTLGGVLSPGAKPTPTTKAKAKAPPPLLREQTKAKVGARPASMVILSEFGVRERERTWSQGVFGSTLRRMGLGAFVKGGGKEV